MSEEHLDGGMVKYERNGAIARLYYSKGLKMREIAERNGISATRVSQIVRSEKIERAIRRQVHYRCKKGLSNEDAARDLGFHPKRVKEAVERFAPTEPEMTGLPEETLRAIAAHLDGIKDALGGNKRLALFVRDVDEQGRGGRRHLLMAADSPDVTLNAMREYITDVWMRRQLWRLQSEAGEDSTE